MQIPPTAIPENLLNIYGISATRMKVEQIEITPNAVLVNGVPLHNSRKIPLILDQLSFHCLGLCFFADKNEVYGMSYKQSSSSEKCFFSTIKGVDLSSFEILNMYHARDKNRYYFAEGGKQINEENLTIVPGYVTDQQHKEHPQLKDTLSWVSNITIGDHGVYLRGKKLPGVDPKSFRQIGFYYFSDNDHIFYKAGEQLIKLNGIDINSFHIHSDQSPYDAADKFKPVIEYLQVS
ncbi:MAG: hypothetical protein JWR38_2077 [Mucilaginibacter sp.]|nr:hypothetical protein [Mucilaginibacter sp.]